MGQGFRKKRAKNDACCPSRLVTKLISICAGFHDRGVSAFLRGSETTVAPERSTRVTYLGIGFVKLIKIRFTAWRDDREAPRSSDLQAKLDAWAGREHVLRGALLRVRQKQAGTASEVLNMEFDAIATELYNIEAVRQPLIDAEVAEVEQAQAALLKHKRVNTFGYQVFNDAGTEVVKIVDESGNDLPAKAVFAYEVVDTGPLPQWAKKGRTRT